MSMLSLAGMFSSFEIETFTDSNKKFMNAIFANGIWQKRKEPVGTFTLKLDDVDGKRLGLTKTCAISFESALPKIPQALLVEIVRFFKEVMTKFSSEVYISIYWDKVKEDYFIYVPTQRVSGSSVVFENDEAMLNNDSHFIVCDIHSHVNMGAFFSGQDIKDEAGSRLFGVIGRLGTAVPEMVIRAAANRQEVLLTLADVFTGEYKQLQADSDYSIPDTEMSKISENRPTYVAPAKAYGSTANTGHAYQNDFDYGYGENYRHNGNAYQGNAYQGASKGGKRKAKTYKAYDYSKSIYSALTRFKNKYTFDQESMIDLVAAFNNYILEEIEEKEFPVTMTISGLDELRKEVCADIESNFEALKKVLYEREGEAVNDDKLTTVG